MEISLNRYKSFGRSSALILCFMFSTFSFSGESSGNSESAVTHEEGSLESYSEAYAEHLLAPIALYPDSLLTHILISATYPLEVVEAERWLNKNSTLTSEQALEKVADFTWDPSVKALIAFPSVLNKLSEELSWTYQLGNLFLAYESNVLTSIQSLRRKADQAGNLDNIDNMTVTKEADSIIIASSQPDVIYVPYYDTRVVYGSWYWHYYPPIHWRRPHHYYYSAYNSPYYFHTGIFLSRNYFYSNVHWHSHHVVVVNHHNKRRHHSSGRLVHNAKAKKWHHSSSHRKGVDYRVKSHSKSVARHASISSAKSHSSYTKNRAVKVERNNTTSNASGKGERKASVTKTSRHNTDSKRDYIGKTLTAKSTRTTNTKSNKNSYSSYATKDPAKQYSNNNVAKKYTSFTTSTRKNEHSNSSNVGKGYQSKSYKSKSENTAKHTKPSGNQYRASKQSKPTSTRNNSGRSNSSARVTKSYKGYGNSKAARKH